MIPCMRAHKTEGGRKYKSALQLSYQKMRSRVTFPLGLICMVHLGCIVLSELNHSPYRLVGDLVVSLEIQS